MPSVAVVTPEPNQVDSKLESASWRLTIGTGLNVVAGRLRRLGGARRLLLFPVAFLCEALSLGIMRPSDVREMVSRTYASRPGFYDPRRYQLPHEQAMLPRLLTHRKSVRLLDAFCGQGREAKLFADAGFDVTGIDQLDWMIEAARRYAAETGFEAAFQTEDFARFAPDEPFNVVYTSCWMYSTVQGVDCRREFLDQCGRLCVSDGIVVVSYVSQKASSRSGAWIRFVVARLAALFTAGNLRTELGERIYTGLFWHHLPDATVDREVTAAGWTTIETVPGTGMNPTFLFLASTEMESVG